jgi:hypothetical protein
MWIAAICPVAIVQNQIVTTDWGNTLTTTSITTSMIVNALVTGLIVFRIFKVFREVKDVTTSTEKSLGVTGGEKLRSIIFVIIESGMALCAIQLARLALTAPLRWTDAGEGYAFELITSIHEMLNVIIIISHYYFIFY